jgi:hypothetical protein
MPSFSSVSVEDVSVREQAEHLLIVPSKPTHWKSLPEKYGADVQRRTTAQKKVLPEKGLHILKKVAEQNQLVQDCRTVATLIVNGQSDVVFGDVIPSLPQKVQRKVLSDLDVKKQLIQYGLMERAEQIMETWTPDGKPGRQDKVPQSSPRDYRL